MSKAVADGVISAAILILYYKFVLVAVQNRLVPVALGAVLNRDASRRHAVGDLENVVTLVISVVLQMALLAVLLLATSVGTAPLSLDHLPLALLALGAVLGLGEMLLGSLLGLLAIKFSLAFPRVGNPLAHWRVVLNSGWMRLFNTTMKVLPTPLAIPVVVLYVGVEELIIRGVVLVALLPLGPVPAIAISTAIFVAYQVFNLPSWRVALFPVLGALVMGPIHGMLYVAVPNVWPLVAAHVSYFVIVALTFR